MRFSAIYGHKFTSMFPTDEAMQVAKAEWADGLAGLSNFQLGQGLNRARMISDWNPNIPEFIRLATNLPNMGQAVQRVCKQNIKDPVTRNLCAKIGTWKLNRETSDNIVKMAKSLYVEAYEEAIDEVKGMDDNWRPPQQVSHQMPEPEPVCPKEKQQQYMQEAKRIIGEYEAEVEKE